MSTFPGQLHIIRYMDVSKYLAMLIDSGLFFASPDRLGDDHEGVLGQAHYDLAIDHCVEKYGGRGVTNGAVSR